MSTAIKTRTPKVSLGVPFRKLFLAFTANKAADGLIAGSMPLLAASLTLDPVLIASLGATSMLPWLIFAIPIGTLVDRLDRRLILVTTGLVRTVIASSVGLALLYNSLSIGWLMLASFIVGTCDVFSDTSTQSLIPKLLPEGGLERGNSRMQAVDTIAIGFAGAPLGSFVFTISAFTPFFVESAGFLAGVFLILSIPASLTAIAVTKNSQVKFTESMSSGIHYLFKHKQLLRLVLTTTVIGFMFQVGTSTQVLFVLHVLNLPEAAFGTLMASGALGALIGAVFATRLSTRFGRGAILAFGITACSVTEVLCGAAPNFWFFAVFTFIGGFGLAMWNILLLSTYQLMIPNEIFGRIHGTRRTLVWGLMPLGMVIGGAIAHLGLRVPPIAAGLLATAVGIYQYRFITRLGNNPPHLSE